MNRTAPAVPAPPRREASAPSIAPAPPAATSRWGRRLGRWAVLLGISAGMIAALTLLLTHVPQFYAERIHPMEDEELKTLSRRFLNKGTMFYNDIQHAPAWQADFDERQINAWLADDFEINHAEHSLPAGVSKPRVAMDGDLLRIGFQYSRGPFKTVFQVAVRTWVPQRNLLAVELNGATLGAIPIPTSHVRRVIEQLADAFNLSVTWKRNGRRLVALLRFPRGPRELVLQRVEVRPGMIRLKGASGRPLYSGDYAPSAN